MENSSEQLFTTRLRKVTRKVHSISDTLVQSRFVVGLIDDRVWAEGLLVFYEIFYYLEASMERQAPTVVGKFNHPALKRAAYFEIDLELYYGPNWKVNHCPKDRECVRNYIKHLKKVEEEEPVLLLAYIYHLYLGLLSGGQILRKKQKLIRASKFSKTSTVVDFEPGVILQVKQFIKNTTNEISEMIDEDTKNRILDESIKVFELNCELIRSVSSTRDALLKIGRTLLLFVITVIFIILLYKYSGSNDNDQKDQ